MKITIDSTEPLEDALRVLGALYAVTLVKAGPTTSPASADAVSRTRRSSPSARGRNATQAPPRPTSAPSTSRRRPRAAAAPTTSDVRAWARANGHQVSDRGPIPASVSAGYAEAHTT